jgi:hypothetical protein
MWLPNGEGRAVMAGALGRSVVGAAVGISTRDVGEGADSSTMLGVHADASVKPRVRNVMM